MYIYIYIYIYIHTHVNRLGFRVRVFVNRLMMGITRVAIWLIAFIRRLTV